MYSSIDSQPNAQSNNNTGSQLTLIPLVLYDVIEGDKYHQFYFPSVGDSLKPSQKTYEGGGEIAKQAVSELVTSLMPAEKILLFTKLIR
ncbi:hypothetical protein [Candidatus Coxiella mudrowiae]|uniref:hypothetical protein n=1 Tax=Candidatus Coxiella mudrowiae TaxID=2054173 RepID=UPI00069E820D|nr:hypothetical protein [Candidatus Coxiella mudrowiae]